MTRSIGAPRRSRGVRRFQLRSAGGRRGAIGAASIAAFVVILVAQVTHQMSGLLQLIGTAATVVGAAAIWYELKRTGQLAEGEFIVQLNEAFANNEEHKATYLRLEASNADRGFEFSPMAVVSIASYLTFFEAIQSLIARRILSYAMIDDLFAYRFYVAVHHARVQELELVPKASSYRNIYALHKGWSAHRASLGRPLPIPELDLALAVPNYDELAAG